MCVCVCVCPCTLAAATLPLLCLAGKQTFKPLIVASSHPGVGMCPRLGVGVEWGAGLEREDPEILFWPL